MSINPMQLFIVEGGKLVAYERTGECSACGDCCEAKHVIGYQVQVQCGGLEDDASPADYSASEGWTALRAQALWWWWSVYDNDDMSDPCASLDPDTRRCTCWMDDIAFPAICRYWPVHPKNVERFPRCTFSFTRVDTHT